MILLTKLDNSPIVVNLETIKYIEPMPDTLIFFLNGDSVIVRESIDDILKKVVEHKAQILASVKERATSETTRT